MDTDRGVDLGHGRGAVCSPRPPASAPPGCPPHDSCQQVCPPVSERVQQSASESLVSTCVYTGQKKCVQRSASVSTGQHMCAQHTLLHPPPLDTPPTTLVSKCVHSSAKVCPSVSKRVPNTPGNTQPPSITPAPLVSKCAHRPASALQGKILYCA